MHHTWCAVQEPPSGSLKLSTKGRTSINGVLVIQKLSHSSTVILRSHKFQPTVELLLVGGWLVG